MLRGLRLFARFEESPPKIGHLERVASKKREARVLTPDAEGGEFANFQVTRVFITQTWTWHEGRFPSWALERATNQVPLNWWLGARWLVEDKWERKTTGKLTQSCSMKGGLNMKHTQTVHFVWAKNLAQCSGIEVRTQFV